MRKAALIAFTIVTIPLWLPVTLAAVAFDVHGDPDNATRCRHCSTRYGWLGRKCGCVG